MATPHATVAKKGRGMLGGRRRKKVKEKMERQRKQRAGKQAHTGLITLTLTGGRMEGGRMEGGREGGRERSAVRQTHIGNQVSFCELKGQRGHSVHVCVSVYLTG